MPGHESKILSTEYVPFLQGPNPLARFLRKPCLIDPNDRYRWVLDLYSRQVRYLAGEDVVIFRWEAVWDARSKSWVQAEYSDAFMLEYAASCATSTEGEQASPTPLETPAQEASGSKDLAKAKGGRKGKGKAVAKSPPGGKGKKKHVAFEVEEEDAVMSPIEEEDEIPFDEDDEDDEEDDDSDEDDEEDDDGLDDDDLDDGMVEQLVEEEEVEELDGQETMSSILRRNSADGPDPTGELSSDEEEEDIPPPPKSSKPRTQVQKKSARGSVTRKSKSAQGKAPVKTSDPPPPPAHPVEPLQSSIQGGDELFEHMLRGMGVMDTGLTSAQDVVPPVPAVAPPSWTQNKRERKIAFLMSLCALPSYQKIVQWYAQLPVSTVLAWLSMSR